MLDLKSLFLHQAWADVALLNAIRADAPTNDTLRSLLHHIVTVQHVLFSYVIGRPFDKASLPPAPDSLDVVRTDFQDSHREMLAYLDGASNEELSRTVHIPFFKDHDFVATDVLLQIVLHSQNHRGQCLMQLRQLGTKPPTLDYILWAQQHPAPAW